MFFDSILPKDPKMLRRIATRASCSVAAILILAKLGAFFVTNSVSIMSSLLDSSLDLMASLVTMVGVARAMMPPDRDHRYGHGKAEGLAALSQSAFVMGSALLLCVAATERFFKPVAIENTMAGYVVMVLSIFLTFFLIALQKSVIRKTQSLAIGADSLHYTGDLFSNVAVIVSLVLQQVTGLTIFDPLFALVVAAMLIKGSYEIIIKSLETLLDKEVSEEQRQKIIELVHQHPLVMDAHDLRTRTDGEKIFGDIHLSVDPEISLRVAHDIGDQCESFVKNEFPNLDLVVHLDPAGHEEPRLDALIEKQDGR